MSTKVLDFVDNEGDFEQLLEEAEENAKSNEECRFIDSLSIKWSRYGLDMFLSEDQHKWLTDIAAR